MNDVNENWKLRLFKKSILKQLKYKMIRKYLGDYRQLRCLDLGSDNGVISYLLRQEGGLWHSADIDNRAVEMIRDAVAENVYLIEANKLPFEDEYFDLVVIVDLLEHVERDVELMQGISRTLKSGGTLIVNVPHLKQRSLIRWLRRSVGLTDEHHGHVRSGYTLDKLARLTPEYLFEGGETYSRGFSELIDTFISWVLSGKDKNESSSRKKIIGEEDLARHKKLFYIYSLFYPVMWLISSLDILLFFLSGHRLVARYKKGRTEQGKDNLACQTEKLF